jgi:hypothetical protein
MRECLHDFVETKVISSLNLNFPIEWVLSYVIYSSIEIRVEARVGSLTSSFI